MADVNNNEAHGEYFKIKLINNGEEIISIRKVNLENTIYDIIHILCETNINIIAVFADDAEVAPKISSDVIRCFYL